MGRRRRTFYPLLPLTAQPAIRDSFHARNGNGTAAESTAKTLGEPNGETTMISNSSELTERASTSYTIPAVKLITTLCCRLATQLSFAEDGSLRITISSHFCTANSLPRRPQLTLDSSWDMISQCGSNPLTPEERATCLILFYVGDETRLTQCLFPST